MILQPFFLLFVFGKVLGSLGYTTTGYSDLLFPGLLALTAVITSMQTLAFPLVIEFGWTKEIEDRLLAPMSTWLVAAEKVLFATIRALIATAVMIPIGILVLGLDPVALGRAPALPRDRRARLAARRQPRARARDAREAEPDQHRLLARLHAASLHRAAASTPGPRWTSCRGSRWSRRCNPMTYVSEGLRAALVPSVPHIAPWICLLVLSGSLVVLLGDRRARLLPPLDRLTTSGAWPRCP